jgi:cardiolipin synthase
MIIRLLPNILSFFRLISAFVLIPLILENKLVAALFLLISASVSDFLDGYIARKFHVSSEFGAMLDPLADKVLMTVSYVLFAFTGFVSVFVTTIVIARDFLILSVVLFCRIYNINLEIRPLTSSKINTTIQLIFIIAVLCYNILSVNIEYLPNVCEAIVVFSTIFSGAEYVQKYYWIKYKIFAR